MPTLNKMQLWLRDYERSRHSKQPNESWAQSKFGNLPWREAREIWLPEVNMTVGVTWNRLRKLWRRYKISGSNGDSRLQTAYDINRLQAALDLPRSDFPELEGVVSDHEFENQDQETGEGFEPLPAEWSSLDQQLVREEQEAEADWWIPDN
jgi:hypothetical protein